MDFLEHWSWPTPNGEPVVNERKGEEEDAAAAEAADATAGAAAAAEATTASATTESKEVGAAELAAAEAPAGLPLGALAIYFIWTLPRRAHGKSTLLLRSCAIT